MVSDTDQKVAIALGVIVIVFILVALSIVYYMLKKYRRRTFLVDGSYGSRYK